jgi:hypothetical protein
MNRALKKTQIDHKLIQNVLELNNPITISVKPLETAREEFTKKKEELNSHYYYVLEYGEMAGYIDIPQPMLSKLRSLGSRS